LLSETALRSAIASNDLVVALAVGPESALLMNFMAAEEAPAAVEVLDLRKGTASSLKKNMVPRPDVHQLDIMRRKKSALKLHLSVELWSHSIEVVDNPSLRRRAMVHRPGAGLLDHPSFVANPPWIRLTVSQCLGMGIAKGKRLSRFLSLLDGDARLQHPGMWRETLKRSE